MRPCISLIATDVNDIDGIVRGDSDDERRSVKDFSLCYVS